MCEQKEKDLFKIKKIFNVLPCLPERMRSEVLAAASVGLTALVLANAWVQRQQFYPSVVYITKSNPSMAVIYLQVLISPLSW